MEALVRRIRSIQSAHEHLETSSMGSASNQTLMTSCTHPIARRQPFRGSSRSGRHRETATPELAKEQPRVRLGVLDKEGMKTHGHRSPPRARWWRLIQDQPVESELLRRVDELCEVHGLANIAVSTQAIALDDVLLLRG